MWSTLPQYTDCIPEEYVDTIKKEKKKKSLYDLQSWRYGIKSKRNRISDKFNILLKSISASIDSSGPTNSYNSILS